VSYELGVIQQIVQGNLSPLYFPLDASKLSGWYQYLSHAPTHCTKRVHAQFGVNADQSFYVDTLQSYLVDKYHPPVFVAEHHQVRPYEEIAGETLLSEVLGRLSLTKEALIEWYHWQDETGRLHLEVYVRYPLDALTPEELRYCYFQQLLAEQKEKVQQQIAQFVHQTSSKKKATKYIQEYQLALLNYCEQLLQQLDAPYQQIYTFSGEYNFPDVFKLIFRELEEVLGYLERQFPHYLDLSAFIPYRLQVVQGFSLDKQWEGVEQPLQQSSLDKSLLKVVRQSLGTVKDLTKQPISYQQLHYYRRLLQELERFVKEDSLSDESVTALLFRLNFNSPTFTTYLVSQLQDRLEAQETLAERVNLLYYYRKYYRQLPVQKAYAYQPLDPSVDQTILSWIAEELVYLQEVGDVPAIEDKERLLRVKTSLSVPQIALLLRLFSEVGIFHKQNKTNIFRRFSRLLATDRKEEISHKAIKDRYYHPDRTTITAVKDKVIAMLNFLNSL
jgi:hypothetical protein